MSNLTNSRSSFPPALRSHRRGRLLALPALLLLVLPIALVAVAPRPALAQTKSFHMSEYNSDITVNTDGSLDVDETLVYVYDEGSFHRGTRNIPIDKVDGITGVRVMEEVNGQLVAYRETNYDPDASTGGVPGTFGTRNDGSQLWVR